MPLLIKAFTTATPHVRLVAAHALKKIGPIAVKAVPALVEGLADPDTEVRRVAAVALFKQVVNRRQYGHLGFLAEALRIWNRFSDDAALPKWPLVTRILGLSHVLVAHHPGSGIERVLLSVVGSVLLASQT